MSILDRAIINAAQVAGEKHSYYHEYGRNPVYVRHSNGVQELIYDPRDPSQMGPYGCLLQLPERLADQRPVAADWQTPQFMQGLAPTDLPDCFLLGPKALAGGKGLGVTNVPCRQEIGDCVGACGTTVIEATLRSEDILGGISQWWIEASIRYDYWHAQGYYSRPGGDGAATAGLAHGLQTYTDGWINRNMPELTVDGRCGGFVHEKFFDGAANLPPEIRNGLPYDSAAERAGRPIPKAFVELGVKHRCGYGQGDCRRVRNWDDYRQVIASGHVCFTGIPWPGNWGRVDNQGFVTAGFTGGGGGHEIAFTGYIKRNAQSGYGGSNVFTRSLAGGDDWWACMQNSWGCFDEETEVLTRDRGWVRFRELTGDDYVATLNQQTHQLEYQLPSERQVYDYRGELWNFRARDVDLLVTPNHNMYVRGQVSRGQKPDWRLRRADELPKNFHMKKDAGWEGREIEYAVIAGKRVRMDDWLEFLGYFISEGHTSGTKQYPLTVKKRRVVAGKRIYAGGTETIMRRNYTVAISQRKPEALAKIEACLARLPWKFCPVAGGWAVGNKALWTVLAPLGKAPKKFIPRVFLTVSRRQLTLLYQALMTGDGADRKYDTQTGEQSQFTYYTSSARLADDLQELLLKIGMAGDVTFSDRRGQQSTSGNRYNEIEYRVGIKHRELEPRKGEGWVPLLLPYTGKIYCVTVPNHVIYVRRNGRAVWCGNSNFGLQGSSIMPRSQMERAGSFGEMFTISFADWARPKIINLWRSLRA